MAVYLSLTAAVVLLGMFVHNEGNTGLHTAPVTRQMRLESRKNGGFTRQQAFHFGMAAMIFLLLTAVSACRIAVGNDYWQYRFQFNLIMQDRLVSYEGGFNIIVWIIQSLLGYDNYIPVFAFFSILTCFFFVKAMKDQGRWFGGTVFLLMTGGYYFSSLNSVRYYVVLAMALFAMKYVLQKRYGAFVLWILAASMFHKSVLLVIPVYLFAGFLSQVDWEGKIKLPGSGRLAAFVNRQEISRLKWYGVLFLILAAAAVAGEPLWRKVIFLFYPFYEGSVFDVRNFSWANIAKCIGTLGLCVICWQSGLKKDPANLFYCFLNLAGLLVYTCCSFIPEVSRVGYYMIASQIFLLPNLLHSMKKGWFKTLCICGVAGAFLLYFALFLKQAYDINIRILPYLNWIFN